MNSSLPAPMSCLGVIEEGPFYAIKMEAGVNGTCGGPRANANAQVLGLNDEPIPGLYVCSNAMAAVTAGVYGGTGGTLDVYLQRKTGTNAWIDWAHFPQVAAATTKRFSFSVNAYGQMASNAMFDLGGGTDATPGVSLAANTATNTIPTGDVRAVFVAGGGTSAGATQTITITPYTERS